MVLASLLHHNNRFQGIFLVIETQEEEEEEEEEERETPAQLLSRMRSNVPLVQKWIKSYSGKSVGVGMLVPPDPRYADADQGDILLKDQQLLSRVMRGHQSINEVSPMGKLAKLVEFWDMCHLSFAMAACWPLFVEKKGMTILRFENAMHKWRGNCAVKASNVVRTKITKRLHSPCNSIHDSCCRLW